MPWRLVGYALACVVLPMAWGLLVVAVSNRAERALSKRRGPDGSAEEASPLPPIDYHI